MTKKIAKFSAILILSSVLVFGVHLFVLQRKGIPLFSNLIIQAYILNILFAVFVYSTLLFLSKSKQHILGFVFMVSSFIKFGLFFLFFYPTYRADNNIDKQEFLTFFIPYAFCLIIETYFLIKHLNSQNTNH